MDNQKVYAMSFNKYTKIGISKDPSLRLVEIQRCMPDEVDLIKTWESKHSFTTEQKLHKAFDFYRRKGEWFLLENVDLGLIKDIDLFAEFFSREFDPFLSDMMAQVHAEGIGKGMNVPQEREYNKGYVAGFLKGLEHTED